MPSDPRRACVTVGMVADASVTAVAPSMAAAQLSVFHAPLRLYAVLATMVPASICAWSVVARIKSSGFAALPRSVIALSAVLSSNSIAGRTPDIVDGKTRTTAAP